AAQIREFLAGFSSVAETGDSLAERVGFEPTIRFHVYTLSKRAPSATRPSLREVSFDGRLTYSARAVSWKIVPVRFSSSSASLAHTLLARLACERDPDLSRDFNRLAVQHEWLVPPLGDGRHRRFREIFVSAHRANISYGAVPAD